MEPVPAITIARRAFGGAIERDVGITDNPHFADSQAEQSFAHARAQLLAAGTSQSYLRRDKIAAPQLCNFTGTVDSFTSRRGRIGNSDSQGV